MERNTVTLSTEPSGALYFALIDAAKRYCSSALLVVRDFDYINPSATDVLNALAEFLEQRTIAAEWPGTRLVEGSATIYQFHLTTGSIEVIKNATDHLYGWLHPDLPEDLCFIRDHGSPWLVSITHERDSYLDLSSRELEEMKGHFPELFRSSAN